MQFEFSPKFNKSILSVCEWAKTQAYEKVQIVENK